MNTAGIDTASFLVRLDPQTASRIARVLPLERRSKAVGGAAHHYGNFRDWSATLHVSAAAAFAPTSLVLTASLPRLLYGENTRPAGTHGAYEGRSRLFERLAGLSGVSLDPDDATVCRVDYCATFTPFARPAELIGPRPRTWCRS